MEEEKRKVVAEWVAVEDAQKAYNKKREAYVFGVLVLVRGRAHTKQQQTPHCVSTSFDKAARARFSFLPPDDVVAFNVGGQVRRVRHTCLVPTRCVCGWLKLPL